MSPAGLSSLPHPPLLVVTDRRLAHLPLEEVAGAVFDAGGRWLLLREKDLEAEDRRARLRRLIALGRPYGARVLVSADIEGARATGAAGVHLPAGRDAAAARHALGPGALIGCSAHDPSEIDAAVAAGADYATLSPVFESASKPGYGPVLGPEGVRVEASRVSLPLLALGGVTAGRVAACRSAGAAGIAVMGEVMRSPDPGAVAAALLEAWGAP